jgi:hypothetical protein
MRHFRIFGGDTEFAWEMGDGMSCGLKSRMGNGR